MKKLTLDFESLAVETFATATEPSLDSPFFAEELISRRSCIEQCTTSCVP